ncbi:MULTISPECIES: sigma-54-dependent transcriptional regulator [Flavobacterium]|jgi:two-component system response regulator HydG|uniref:Two-component system response regulator HydG n=1 Tax=Flavobacterium lindanitolerans TaxID=428988 RepID=A0A497U3T1_9FLAO|nr:MULTISPECIES: sigma-54 dependent transcriptional regulator [Flavobacterium]PZO29047.1 MAG: sigma-54-dependent Fis family transcriptional regulator [Flavobacteriaceae bacterium]PZQ87280.1 MAG: sigma-54-dependent Fis family transcriptional regulator [Flavobacterium johnsoniae]KQS48810.1 two-component system response regulator [Flavobacterium sp. Leaf359]MDQ7959839.1 sigma-54 dependent transcriptional regulator [Flavobacterium lindanitolerans]PKW19972.1 two-component system response regulator 
MSSKILVIDDDTSFCVMLKTFLQKKGYDVTNAFNAKEAEEAIRNQIFDVVLTDIRLPDSDGIQILKYIKETSFKTQVVLMTGYTDIKTAVSAMKMGAYDYVGKPINPDEILHTIEQALKKRLEKPEQPVTEKKEKKETSSSDFAFVKGGSSTSNQLHEYISLVSPTNMSVLIIGDSGTGKEYIAHTIHTQSKRKDKPFIPVDCGAIPKELASSEFFGHIKGSFTGAINDKTGHFEAANGGTLFLDEVGNLSYEVQIQLLRALQERKVKPVGSNHEVKVDIRVIAATNEDLSEAVKRGDFREDLYHRLNEFCIQAPKLSERKQDIMVFAHHFLALANDDLEKNIEGFDDEVIELFMNYDWPGNLREMKNTIKRSVLLTKSNSVPIDVLPQEMRSAIEQENAIPYYSKENEESAIRSALEKAGFNKTKAAKLLNIDRKTLYNKLKLYSIDL